MAPRLPVIINAPGAVGGEAHKVYNHQRKKVGKLKVNVKWSEGKWQEGGVAVWEENKDLGAWPPAVRHLPF